MRELIAASFGLLVATGAAAQTENPAAKALGDCLVAKSTGEDRLLVARWLLASLASAPQVKDVTTPTPGKKVTLDKGMAGLFTRLLTVDCKAGARPVFKQKTQAGFTVAGEALGRVAMTELLSNKDALAALATYVEYLDEKDFKEVTAP